MGSAFNSTGRTSKTLKGLNGRRNSFNFVSQKWFFLKACWEGKMQIGIEDKEVQIP
jgi:hypothetical protein